MSDEPLTERIATWLGEQGYRLEYRAYHAFREAGLQAALSRYVTPGDGGTPREIDVTVVPGTAKVKPKPSTRRSIVMALCECKYSTEHPWLLMRSELKSDPIGDWYATPRSPWLQHENASDLGPRLKDAWHFSGGHEVAHTLLEGLKKKGNDVAYDALQKIANASWDWADTPGEARVAIPILVVQGPLFEAWLDGDTGKFEVKPVRNGRIRWFGCRRGTMVYVVQDEAVDHQAEMLKNTFAAIQSQIFDKQRS